MTLVEERGRGVRGQEHFHRDGALVIGLTPVGRTTVWLFQVNIKHRVHPREWIIAESE